MEFEKIKRKSLDHYHSERLKTYSMSNFDSNNTNYDSYNSFNPEKRVDKFGNVISKKNKKNYKISFVDEIDSNKPIAKIMKVESFRRYNSMEEKKGKF